MTRYALGEELGGGALGRVVLVSDRHTGEALAGKILHASHRTDDRALARFRGEARMLADLSHPNLVAVHGLAEIEGEEVLLMERIEGPSLARVIAAQAPLPESRAAAIGQGIASGLAAAHRAGLVHRDLKPQNVLLTEDDRAKIVDFGLARATSLAAADPNALALVGTPDTMPPEALDPLAIDPRSDLYSLGCILFEMATGRPPFSGATAVAVLEAHRRAPIPDLRGAGVSDAYAELAEALLQKSPADRPQSAASVAAALRDLGLPARSGGGEEIAHGGACAHCGAPLVTDVSVCFGCAEPQPSLSPGQYSVFVTGPGAVTDKLDTELRGVLVEWLRENPALRLDPDPLARKVPRLPFALVSGVSRGTAEELAASVAALGLEAEVRRGGRYALPAMRRKSWSLAGRTMAIAGPSMAGMTHVFIQTGLVPVMLGAVLVAGAGGFWVAARQVVPEGARAPALPAPVTEALGRVSGVVPAMRAARHRDSLRAVAQRAVQLCRALPPAERADTASELAQLIDLSVLAATRIDELEASLDAGELTGGDAAARAKLRERDRFSARLLETTALLDALRVRAASASSARTGDDETLREIRAHVDALEEVSRL